MSAVRTSLSHPLQIASVHPAEGFGLVGLTLCPGKIQSNGITGAWRRDLGVDLDAVSNWNAAAVVTLVEDHELEWLQVPHIGHEVSERHMAWHHLPIGDRDVPTEAFERIWRDVGEGLRACLRDGANVLVHCMGGLGRAGTIASRLLIELGMEAEAAIPAVRTVRPGAIETAGQLARVREYTSIPERLPDRSPEAVRDRAVGALLGLAVGDAVGTTLEFRRRDSYPRLTDMVGGGPFGLEAGQWTDDTAMALALASSLVEREGLDEADLMARFVAWREEGLYSCTGTCFDIGLTVRQALTRFENTRNPIAGSTDPMSAGNGSLMRLAPVAIRYWQNRVALEDVAARQSRTTHGAAEAVDACIAYAGLLADAIAGMRRSEVMAPHHKAFAGAIAPIMTGAWRTKHRDAIRASGYVAHSLEAALWAVARTTSFSDAILLAANLGEDADTTAAIAGQLAGALYGAAGIPRAWRERLAWAEQIESLALELTAPVGWYPDCSGLTDSDQPNLRF